MNWQVCTTTRDEGDRKLDQGAGHHGVWSRWILGEHNTKPLTLYTLCTSSLTLYTPFNTQLSPIHSFTYAPKHAPTLLSLITLTEVIHSCLAKQFHLPVVPGVSTWTGSGHSGSQPKETRRTAQVEVLPRSLTRASALAAAITGDARRRIAGGEFIGDPVFRACC